MSLLPPVFKFPVIVPPLRFNFKLNALSTWAFEYVVEIFALVANKVSDSVLVYTSVLFALSFCKF